ncbi:CD3324 family protein [Intestinibacter bartlettii]|uniref:CD3324 family protein n=1 Tax=Intestinibacter bartlettii TaxID=261299 RepID=UPI00248C4C64|nr:CD3324 family protein [Intestinibacter bartlettii]
MKYKKVQDILPQYMIDDLQQYIEGGYLYIPKKEENKKSWGENTNTKKELNKRNKEIVKKRKNGKSIQDLAKEYFLTEYSIRRIIKKVDL